MPMGSTAEKTPGFYADLSRRRRAYESELIRKGVRPRSRKMAALMHRKFART